MHTLGHGILLLCFRSQIATESERCFFGLRLSVTLLSSLADLATKIDFSREKTKHANAPNMPYETHWVEIHSFQF